ncbi:hypothetical protein [Abiotrophia defectiva]|uniref:hypothetical protein n=1 Tax=Abiotrophia defectiva TaxID=46125 RepID=UPI0026F14873|nr:hypothetical protein [Abiotrophia defectiva]
MKKIFLLLPLLFMLAGFKFPEDKHLVDRNNLEKTQTEIATNFKIDNLWYPFDTNGRVHERYSIASYSMDKSKGQFMIFIRGDLNGKYTINQVAVNNVPKAYVKEILESFGVGITPSIKDVIDGNNRSADHADEKQFVYLSADEEGSFSIFVLYDSIEVTELTE